MKKNVLIVLGVLVLFIIGIFIALVAVFVIKDLSQEDRLKKDIASINDLFDMNNLNEKEIRKRLKSYVATGDNLRLEKALKAYYNDALDYAVVLDDVLNDKRLTNSITINNFKNDGPDFVNTKAYLQSAKNELEKVKKEILNHISHKKVMSYINSKKMDSYYVDLYEEILSDFDFFGTNSREAEESIDSVIISLNRIESVIDFLIGCKGKWQIIGNRIIFLEDSLSAEFNSLLSEFEYDSGYDDEVGSI